MNGYTLKQFGDFEKDWHLVTVRYRQDTGEMRFTYANEAAWKTLSEGKTDYPDGAVFGKVGMMTKPDPAFVSSLTPNGVRRFQFMVRDQKRHSDDDGWGYALFDGDGKLYSGDVKSQTAACVACHRIVADRGEVFSQSMARVTTQLQPDWMRRIAFEDREVTKLSATIRKHLSNEIKFVRLLNGTLSQSAFFGTLDEVQPLLAAEVLRSGQPALLLASNGRDFSLVVTAASSSSCNSARNERALTGVHSLPGKKMVYENHFCQAP